MDKNRSFSGRAATGTIAGHDYVDLGLSVMWATCNVGASSPEEYGDHYAWGETSTNSSCETFSKNISDLGGTSRDVAHVKWGGSWRMPTKAEFDELSDSDNCKWTWTIQGGHEGCKVTSRKNGNSIFLPAAGWRSWTSLDSAGQRGNYWISTPWHSDRLAYNFDFSGSFHRCSCHGHVNLRYRGNGRSIRPVAELSLGDDVEMHRRLLAGNDDSVSQPLGTLAASPQSAKVKGTIAGHEFVDLGLSVKWATCNVGADSPEEYGDYYAWGETETKSSYDKDNCETYRKGNDDIGSTSRDVARVKWGSPWRLPIWAEFKELCSSDNCTWTWTTQGGHEGYKVTSKKNGNSIFLPAAGRRDGPSLDYAGQRGIYWGSTPGEGTQGDDLNFNSDDHRTGSDLRNYGLTVRPVADLSLGDDVETHRRLLAGNDESVLQPANPPTSSRQVAKDKEVVNGHEFVDLGLSVKWATCNVGASSPEEYGDYYAWGETSTKSSYDEDNCETWGKEIGDISGTSSDVARVKWGSPWRMPTKAEFNELCYSDDCTWTWTTQGGHKGYKVTSRKNGNSIFLPAAGLRSGPSLLLYDAFQEGNYWGSTPDRSGTQNACYLTFFSFSSDHGTYWIDRNVGHTVRPVMSLGDDVETHRRLLAGNDDNVSQPLGTLAASPQSAKVKGTIAGHEYVDLGLSVKWATCNVGASSPEGYGDYYAWGETSIKSSYNEGNCETLRKEIGDIGGTSRDVARFKWGSPWRMPTRAEFYELLDSDNCIWTRTTQGGHKGYKVMSRKNGNSIFLPAAGLRKGTSLDDAGQYSNYWSSTPDGISTWGACGLSFDSGGPSTGWGLRYYGRTVRPVAE